MARKSRKNIPVPDTATAKMTNALRTAFYIRLSVENNQGRGNSIDNQQLVLRDYIADRPEFLLVQTYIDNGLTGTNFNRPEFQRMLADIEAGSLDCVMVKDLSRLGRNFIDTSYYIEQYFFSHHIRFVAVTDQFDTADQGQSHGGIMLPLKNMINEAYALDIGKKIRAQQHQAMLDGKFVGSRPPYGYLKDPQDCHHLVVDPETAPVVRQIFAWVLERVPINEIVRRLNTQGILTPSHERRQKGILTNDAQMGGQYWQSRTVLKILSSEVYMGDLVQGKSQTVDHKQRPASAEHHITVRDTHEALISREMFAEVQRIRAEAGKEAKAVRKKHFTPNMFIGKVFCAHCGRALHRQWAARKVMPDRYTYYCLTNSRYERGVCPGVCIEEQELRAIVTELLIRAINLELGKSVSELNKAASQDIGEVIRKEISSKHQELERNRKFLRGLFEHLVQHLITQEEYQSMKDDYDAKVSSLVGEIETLTKQQAQLQEKSEKSAGLKSDAEYLSTQRELTADLIGRLIEQIEIDHEHHVTVSYSFTDTFVEVRKP
ncbi:MAG: recombinase family protein [Clostridia bacterium]|nr:recombinase family protein [Clostridia bacterium]